MRISLVICTHNRAYALPQLFAAIEALECAESYEVILVDNNSTDDTPKVLADFAERAGKHIRVTREPVQGVASARNTGFKLSKGAIVAFSDDDCYVHPSFLTSVLACFDEQPSLGFLGGRVLLHDPTDYRITIKESEHREDFLPHQFILPGVIHGANFAFRRDAFVSVGGFDAKLGAGTPYVCEDVDMLARVSDAGWHGAYDPRPLVYHHHRRKTAADASKLQRVYARGRGAYYIKSVIHLRGRRQYLSHWYYSTRYLDWRTAAREISAAFTYLCTRGVTSRFKGSLGR